MPTFHAKFAKFANSAPLGIDHHMTAAVGAQTVRSSHDIALVQAMLKEVRDPKTGRSFYQARIDGQTGRQTNAAISAFQAAEGRSFSLDLTGFFDATGNGIKALAQKYRKHIVVMEGTSTPYLVTRVTESMVTGRVLALDWAEPVFRQDLANFAVQVNRETGMELTFQPLPGTMSPACETGAEALLVRFIWINAEGQETWAQGNNMTGFTGAGRLQQCLHDFARQFELFFKVGGRDWPLVLEQSPVRFQERVRKNPLLNSVWVENPVKRQELILVNPKTGRLRTQGSGDKPIVLVRGLGGQTRFEPPCSLPKLEAWHGSANPVMIEFPSGLQSALYIQQQKATVPSPRPVIITEGQARALGLDDREIATLMLNAFFASAGPTVELRKGVDRMLAWPIIERITEAAIGAEVSINFAFKELESLQSERIRTMVGIASKDPTVALQAVLNINAIGLLLMPKSDQARLSEFLGVIRDNAVPSELVHIGEPIDGEIQVMIMNKGEAPASTGNSILDGAPITLGYLRPGQLKSLGEWARSVQNTHRPPPQDFNDPVFEVVNVAGAFAADILIPRNWNFLALLFGAIADSKTIIEGLAHIVFKEGRGKAVQLAAKRAFPQGTIANALKRFGVEPQTANVNEERIRLDLEGVIVELLEGWLKDVTDILFGKAKEER